MRRTVATSAVGWVTSLFLIAHLAADADRGLVEAVKNRDTKAIAALLKQQVDVNATQADGATALHWAAHWDDVATAERLLRVGARVNVTNDYGVTPLLLACSDASAAMIELLLNAGADALATLPDGETALMSAVHAGNVAAVKALLARRADPNAKEAARGQTALMWAATSRQLEIARILVEMGANARARSTGGFTPLMFAARAGDLEMARLLLTHGADVNEIDSAGESVLLVATVRGHVELAKFLLEHGANPNAGAAGYTALHWAAGIWEDAFTTDFVNAPGEWGVLIGLPTSKLELITALLAHGADVNARIANDPPRPGRTSGIRAGQYLIGATPFYVAALSCDVEVMRLLLANGANPELRSRNGATPLIIAAGMVHQPNETELSEGRHLEAVKLLLDLSADVHATSNLGFNALHAATFAEFDSIVQLLIEKGVDVNAKTKAGQTPLGIAEGHNINNFYRTAPRTAALLRTYGGVSEGALRPEGVFEKLKTLESSKPQKPR